VTQYHEEKFTVGWNDPDTTDEADETNAGGAYCNISLSELKNAGKNTFCPGDTAYLEVEASGEYTVQASRGNLKKNATGVPVSQSETINLDNASELSLRRDPANEPSIVWNPPIDVAITRDGRDITLSKPVLSIATITYNSMTDIYALSGITETTDVRVIANAAGNNSALTVSFLCDSEEVADGDKIVASLEAYSCTTGAKKPGVRVDVNGQYQGYTNSNGIVSIGERTVGETINIKLTASDGVVVETTRVVEASS